jgi:hypothetical protein
MDQIIIKITTKEEDQTVLNSKKIYQKYRVDMIIKAKKEKLWDIFSNIKM